MNFWTVREVSKNEHHVVETRYEGEPEFILARCTGPVPANDIAQAMRIAQLLRHDTDGIRNSIFSIDRALKNFKQEIAEAEQERNG